MLKGNNVKLTSILPKTGESNSNLACRGVAQLARAAVSKTAGRGFESCRPCHAGVVESVDTPS